MNADIEKMLAEQAQQFGWKGSSVLDAPSTQQRDKEVADALRQWTYPNGDGPSDEELTERALRNQQPKKADAQPGQKKWLTQEDMDKHPFGDLGIGYSADPNNEHHWGWGGPPKHIAGPTMSPTVGGELNPGDPDVAQFMGQPAYQMSSDPSNPNPQEVSELAQMGDNMSNSALYGFEPQGLTGVGIRPPGQGTGYHAPELNEAMSEQVMTPTHHQNVEHQQEALSGHEEAPERSTGGGSFSVPTGVGGGSFADSGVATGVLQGLDVTTPSSSAVNPSDTFSTWMNNNPEGSTPEVSSWMGEQPSAAEAPAEGGGETHEGRRKQAWSGFGPALKKAPAKVAGWDWSDRLNGYVANTRRMFTCGCGNSLPVPGYHNCKCGKIWNSTAIGSLDNMKEGSAERYIVRSIPVRDGVIVARKQANGFTDMVQKVFSGPSGADLYGDGMGDASKHKDHSQDSQHYQKDYAPGYTSDGIKLPGPNDDDNPYEQMMDKLSRLKMACDIQGLEYPPTLSRFLQAAIHDITETGECTSGEDPGTPTMKDNPEDWAKRDDKGKWYRGDGHYGSTDNMVPARFGKSGSKVHWANADENGKLVTSSPACGTYTRAGGGGVALKGATVDCPKCINMYGEK